MEFKDLSQQINTKYSTIIILFNSFLLNIQYIFTYNTNYKINNKLIKWIKKNSDNFIKKKKDKYLKSTLKLINLLFLFLFFQSVVIFIIFNLLFLFLFI